MDVGFNNNMYYFIFSTSEFLNNDCEKTQLKQQREFTKSVFEMLSVAVSGVLRPGTDGFGTLVTRYIINNWYSVERQRRNHPGSAHYATGGTAYIRAVII